MIDAAFETGERLNGANRGMEDLLGMSLSVSMY